MVNADSAARPAVGRRPQSPLLPGAAGHLDVDELERMVGDIEAGPPPPPRAGSGSGIDYRQPGELLGIDYLSRPGSGQGGTAAALPAVPPRDHSSSSSSSSSRGGGGGGLGASAWGGGAAATSVLNGPEGGDDVDVDEIDDLLSEFL
eukprot:COSAG01_NODE_7590_length_3134_cov_3.172266_1_plen_147_part_00